MYSTSLLRQLLQALPLVQQVLHDTQSSFDLPACNFVVSVQAFGLLGPFVPLLPTVVATFAVLYESIYPLQQYLVLSDGRVVLIEFEDNHL